MLEVGRITKPHGVLGEVLVQLVTTETSRVDPGTVLIGDGREFTVVSSKAHKDRWIVQFEGLGSREAADAVRGVALHAEAVDDADDPEAFWVHELIGAVVVDTDGRSYGPVVSVEDNPASDILVLESGRLVPLTFVTRWRERPTLLEIDPPEGLFEF